MSASDPNESIPGVPLGNAPWWARQQGYSSAVYGDSTLVQNFVSPFRNGKVGVEGKKSEPTPFPERFSVEKYGMIKSGNREQHVRAYENHNKVSQGGWVSKFL